MSSPSPATVLDRQTPLALANVVVVALKPFAFDANEVCHRVQFLLGVRQHVAHEHVAEPMLGLIDVDAH